MLFHIEPNTFESYPQLKIGILTVSGIDNGGTHPSIHALVERECQHAEKKYVGRDIATIPKVLDWNEAGKLAKYRPSSHPSAIVDLMQHVIRGGGISSVNPIVDLCHFVSIKYLLPTCAHDLDPIRGAISFTTANRSHSPMEENSQKTGEIICRDDIKILPIIWGQYMGKQGSVTAESQNVILMIAGLTHTSTEEIVEALRELCALIQQHCGGVEKCYYLDRNQPKVRMPFEIITSTLNKPLTRQPDYHCHEPFQIRSRKLKEIREIGVDPYPHKYTPMHRVHAILKQFEGSAVGNSGDAEEGTTPKICVAGRMILFRAMGKNAFAHIQDEMTLIQVMFNRDHTKVAGLPPIENSIKFIEKYLDLGDIVGIRGSLFRTRRGELTLYAKEVTLLCKTLLPLPDKHGGLESKEICYRKRYLDLIAHPMSLERLKTRSVLISKMRSYYENAGFIEVETPVLQNIYGGAEARPFVTKFNARDKEVFLRISPEISLKKLIVGGLPRIFEIGKVYRNEGIDRTHNPEFTILEAYAAYWDYHDLMTFNENLFAHLAKELYGTTAIGKRQDRAGNWHEIDLKPPWIRMTMKEAIKSYGDIHVDALSSEEMCQKLKGRIDIDIEALRCISRGKLIALLFEEFAEHHLIHPHYIIDHPIETIPLCKPHRNPSKVCKERLVERLEAFILGWELCNGYTELNDPELQRTLLEEQNIRRERGDSEAHPIDEEFIEAICQGMPPTGGIGIGVDRLIMLLTQASSIRDVIYFPIMREG